MKNFAILIFVLSALQVKAQYPSDNGRFTVDQKSGCAPFTFTVTAPECDGTPSCTIDLGNGSTLSLTTVTKTLPPYPDAGNFTLTIAFGSDLNNGHLNIEILPNIKPTFEMYACEGKKVSVKITDTNYDTYIINYDDGNSATVPNGNLAKDVHQFAFAGVRTISVRGQNSSSAPNCSPQVQTIDVTQTLQPAFISQLEAIDAINPSQIKLDYNTPPTSNQLNTQYKLEIAPNSSTTFQQLQTIFNTKTTTISNLRPDDNFYCFRMATFDACTNAIVLASYSNIICSANFDLDIQSDVNKLKWVTYSTAGSNVSGFDISKTPGTPLAAISSATFLDDVDITCNLDYCYQLTTNYSNGSQSISLQKCGRSFSNIIPAAVEDISSIVSETGSALTWLQDPAFTPAEYTIIKSTNGNYSFLAKTTTQTYDDVGYLTESNSCYKISYTDACLNASPLSSEACPIQLSGSLNPNNSISLSWSDYTGWKNGVNNYVVQKFTSQGQLIETSDDLLPTTTSYLDLDATEDFTNQTYIYVITATANDGGVSESISNPIIITKEAYLTHPTAFSPRGNEPKNQTFKVFGQYVSSFEMRVFNRWGQELFYTNDFDKGWDGTYNGNLMPEGTYVFTAKIRDFEGKASDRSGTIVLLKK
ncbi:MAG: gliding motility-associated C-terminal domain-containing protein [Chryseolinea sp.]